MLRVRRANYRHRRKRKRSVQTELSLMRRYITNCGFSLIGFAIVAICTACDQGTGDLKKRMDALEIKVAGMEGSIQATTKISFEGGRRHSVELDSSDSGNKSYQAISTSDNNFIFLVMLDDIKP